MSKNESDKRIFQTGYTPVDCSVYATYELAILRGNSLRVCWIDCRNQYHLETLIPYDLRTRRRSEFMLAYNQEGTRRILRLDQIVSATVIKSDKNLS